jgi:hypothetical protein
MCRPLKIVLYASLLFGSIAVLAADVIWASPLPKKNRLLGIGLTTSEINDLGQSYTIALGAGLEAVEHPIQWDAFETSPGVFDSNGLSQINALYAHSSLQVHINLNPIDTLANRLPADLKNKTFNDPMVIARYKAAADYILSNLPNTTILSLGIGNEVDIYLTNHPSQWSDYIQFLQAVTSQLRSSHPGLKLGVKTTCNGLINSSVAQLQSLNAYCDYILVTYYPANADITVPDPSGVGSSLDRLVAIYPNKPVYVWELGFPSTTVCGSSEALQAKFIQETFTAWDRQADHIPLINFMYLHDLSQEQADLYVQYYQNPAPAFREYLRTLGLRTYAGTDKIAFGQLKQEASVRGWSTNLTPQPTPTATPALVLSTPDPLTVFPNPVHDVAFFQFNHLPQTTEVKILLFNSAGEKISQIQGTINVQTPRLSWKMPAVADGIYFYQAYSGGKLQKSGKLYLKQH